MFGRCWRKVNIGRILCDDVMAGEEINVLPTADRPELWIICFALNPLFPETDVYVCINNRKITNEPAFILDTFQYDPSPPGLLYKCLVYWTEPIRYSFFIFRRDYFNSCNYGSNN